AGGSRPSRRTVAGPGKPIGRWISPVPEAAPKGGRDGTLRLCALPRPRGEGGRIGGGAREAGAVRAHRTRLSHDRRLSLDLRSPALLHPFPLDRRGGVRGACRAAEHGTF